MAERYEIHTGTHTFALSPVSYLSQPKDFTVPIPATWQFITYVKEQDVVWEMELFTDEPLGTLINCELWVIYTNSVIVYTNCSFEKIDDMIYKVYTSDCYLREYTP